MDGSPSLEALVAPLRDDVVSGAAEVARMASDVLFQATSTLPGETLPAFRHGLVGVGNAVLDAQPAMAPLVALVRSVLLACAWGDDADTARKAAAEAARSFGAGLKKKRDELAERAVSLLPEGGRVLTLSASSTVRQALLADPDRASLSVVVLESRPHLEGRRLAAALAEAGVPVMVAVDAAAAALVSLCDLVLLGADSVGDLGVVNKVGSRSVAEAAKRAAVPVVVLADTAKILPPGFPQPLGEQRPPSEVWDAPPGVSIWNGYFEAVPLTTVTSLVTEESILSPEELEAYRRNVEVPQELRAWAEDRAVRSSGPRK